VNDSGAPLGATRAVHQFVPALIPRDATGSHTLLLRQALRRAGWRSEIFAEATHDELVGESVEVTRYGECARAGDVLIYQFSTSSMVGDFLAKRPEPLILDYHNVTRPELYEPWDPMAAARSAEAFAQLELLAPRAALGLADSAFNEADLVTAGCRSTAVVPVLVDVDRVTEAPEPRVAERLRAARRDGGANWLFVGRVVPSKAQHELVKAFWAYRRLYDGAARLYLVGSTPSRHYLRALRDFIAGLGLTTSVHLSGEVSESALAAYFEAADVYVSLSVHEGFGVPLLESMRAGVPVVARRTGAVPATVGDAGLILERGEPSYVAAAVRRVLVDAELRRRFHDAASRRIAEYSLERCGALAVRAISQVAGTPPGES